jgi:hypothetical protein
MKTLSWFLTGLILISTCLPAVGSEPPRQISQLYDRLETLIVQYYPRAFVERKGTSLKAKYNTRTFMIHHSLKTGEWQEAMSQEGPNREGMICSIESSDGPYAGCAMVPQTFDYCYFKSSLLAPYNKRLNKHLSSHLDFPSGTPSRFIEDYCKLVQSFASESDK